jgi:hypothetical protein
MFGLKRRAPAPVEADAAADDVVPSGHALSVVSSWLPPADSDDDYDALQDWGDQPAAEEAQRPARRVRDAAACGAAPGNPDDCCAWPHRLGLGAKYLSHARAAALMNPLERRMQRQLGAVRAARLADGEDDAQPPAGHGKRVGGMAGHAHAGRGAGSGRGGSSARADAEAAPQVRERWCFACAHTRR